MSNLSQNKTDKFFRQALKSTPELSPSEKDWNDMERLLKGKPNKRPAAGWFYWPAGIAAGLLIFLSLWLSRDSDTRIAKDSKPENGSVETQNKDNGTNHTVQTPIPAPALPFSPNSNESKTPDLKTAQTQWESNKPGEGFKLSGNPESISSDNRKQFQIGNKAVFQKLEIINPLHSKQFIAIETVSLQAGKKQVTDNNTVALENSIEKPGSRLALSMAFTTDMNTVTSMGNSKAGLSFGMGLNYKISNILSAGTGIYYSQKKYTSDSHSYYTVEKPFSTWASYSKQIDAACKVLDIPLNLNVLVSKSKKTGIIASAGLSSYIMLSEKYNFIYSPTPSRPSTGREYTLKNENQHLLSIVNLSIGVEKPLGNQSSIVIQPYAKLPLSGIGQGETELKSFGIGFQVNYSMKKKNKFFNRQSE